MTDLVPYSEPARVSTFEIMPAAIELAGHVARTEFVPSSLRGKPEAVVAAILQGHELGLEPMASLNKIHVVDGRPTLAAELMRALVQRAGHEIWLEEASSTKVTMGGRRRGEEHPTRITWTIDDAKRARLDQKNNWRQYPRAMLTARATGELCRLLFADVLAGISYTIEEVRDGFELDEETALAEVDAAVDAIGAAPEDVPPAPAPTTTRTATRSATSSETAPAEGSSTTTTRSGTGSTRGRRAAPPAPEPPEPDLDELAPALKTEEPKASTPAPVAAGDHVAGDTIPGPSTSSSERSYTPGQAFAIRCREAKISEDERHGMIAAYTGGRTSSTKDLSAAEIRALFDLVEAVVAGELTISSTGEGDDVVWLVRTAEGETVFASDEAPTVIEEETIGGAQSDSPAEGSGSAGEPGTAEEGPESTESGPNPGTEPPTIPDEPEFDVDGDGQGPGTPSIDVPASEDGWRSFLRSNGWKVGDALRAAAALAGDPASAPRSLRDVAENPDLGVRLVAHVTGEELS